MSLLTIVNAYLTVSALMFVAAGMLILICEANLRLGYRLSPRFQLRIAYLLISGIVLLPILTSSSSREGVRPHVAQVWSAPTAQLSKAIAERDSHLTLSKPGSVPLVPFLEIVVLAAAIVGVGAGAWLVLLSIDASRAFRMVRQASPVRRLGRVRLLASDAVDAPCSLWTFRSSIILMPVVVFERPGDLRIALRHEAEHHRHGDALLLWLLQIVRAFFLWNPAAHMLVRQVLALQELACDERVLARHRLAPDVYCRSLVSVAELAVSKSTSSVVCSMLGSSGRALHRRIRTAYGTRRRPSRRPTAVVVGAAAGLLLLAASLALSSPIRDRRISIDQVYAMADLANRSLRFSVTVNAGVVDQLNRLIATPDGLAYVSASMERMLQYQTLVAARLTEAGLPSELAAIPLVESGYQNLLQGRLSPVGAGVWMFIEPTAQRYGLVVSPQLDERLDVDKATQAAMRLLNDLYGQFGDWNLVLMAYNSGAPRVREGIQATGSANPWTVIDQGYEADPGFVSRVLATMLIVRNPDVLR